MSDMQHTEIADDIFRENGLRTDFIQICAWI